MTEYKGYAESVCPYILKAGPRRGKRCGESADADGYCDKHARIKNRGSKRTVAKPKQKLEVAVRERADIFGMLSSGELKVEDLSWAELKGGFVYVRDTDGNVLTEEQPELIPKAFYQQLTRALIQRAEMEFRLYYDDAMKAITELVKNPRTPARERLAAAQYVIERCIGKIPDKQLVDVTVSEFQSIVDSGELIVDVEVEDVPAP